MDIKSKVISLVKTNKWLYSMYYTTFSFLFRLLGLFVKSDKKQILFVCYGGRKYGDNVRPVYLAMLSDERFNDWEFLWAFRNPNTIELPEKIRSKKCKIDTPTFFYQALKSKIWITNVDIERGLHFKNKGTFYVNLWHGVPMKYIRLDNNRESGIKTKAKQNEIDLVCSMGTYDAKISRSAFGVNENKIKVTGYPRNEMMFISNIGDARKRVAKYCNINFSKKIVLYAPTYRDNETTHGGAFKMNFRITENNFSQILGDDYCLLVRAHGAIHKSSIDSDCIDVTNYPDIEDLLMVSDILISDYSGVIFDYSLLEKPIICFPYDLDEYINNRGLYIDYTSFLPFKKCYTEHDLYNTIKSLDIKHEKKITKEFRIKCGLIGKGATKNVIEEICKGMLQNGKTTN